MDSPQEEALFGRWLRKRRMGLDMTQKALARQVGCSPATIRKLEADERHPSRHLAQGLAAALGVPEPERDAFIRFARGGWADRPPSGAGPDLERPWLAGTVGGDRVATAESALQVVGERSSASERESAEAREGVPDAPRVVAREGELERLDRELELAMAGSGRVALVSGEAGQGKTALMTAFAARAQAAHPELLVAVGTCNAYTGHGDPFLPFRQILSQLTGDVPYGRNLDAYQRERAIRLARRAPQATRALLEHGPHLLDRIVPLSSLRARLQEVGVVLPPVPDMAVPEPVGFRDAADRGQLALRDETATTLAAVAVESPLLLVLDDLHWLDEASAELLLHLARVAPGYPLMLLCAYRPDHGEVEDGRPSPVRRALGELVRGAVGVIDLDRADGRAFVDAWLDSESNFLDSEFRASLVHQTAGHPLFTIELLRAMQDRGDLVRDDAGRLRATPELHWDTLPTRIADALATRIERLGTPARDILRVASVEGETFTGEVVARVLERDTRQVVRTLAAELERVHRLVAAVEVKRGPAGLVSRYRFRHNLIQRYVYDATDVSERAYLHETIAAALEALLGEDADPVALALHYTLARAPGRAATHHRKAGDQARKAYAIDQAIEHYQAALEHWTDPDPVTRAALQRDLGECQWLLLRLEDARRNIGEARDAFERAGDLQSAGWAQLALVDAFVTISQFTDNYERAFEAARRAVAMLERSGESAALAAALNTLGRLHGHLSEFAESVEWGERAMAMAESTNAKEVLAVALDNVGAFSTGLDASRLAEAIGLLERSFRLADELGLAHEACRATNNLGAVLEGFGRYPEARARYQFCLEYASRHQITASEVDSRFRLWSYAWTHGDWSSAFEQRGPVDSLSDGTVLEFRVPQIAIGLASSELDLGRATLAKVILERAGDELRHLARPVDRVPAIAVQLRAAASLGDQHEAHRLATSITDVVGPEPPMEFGFIAPVLEAFRHLVPGSTEGARRRAAACVKALTRLARHYDSPEANASIEEARALAAAAGGSFEESVERHVAAADAWQAGTFPLWEARARAAAAHALRRVGRDAEAGSQLERAQGLLTSLAEQIPDDERRDSFARVSEAMLTARAT